MKITMNIYVCNVRNKGFDIKDEVFNRFSENDCQDLYDAVLDMFPEYNEECEKACDKLDSFLESSFKELEKYIEVDEDSLEIDEVETDEWDCKGGLAYRVCIDFDIDKILNKT